jgi:sulfopyruvate decarboxylase subunit alpha
MADGLLLSRFIIDGLKEAHIDIVAGVPESLLKTTYYALENEPDLQYIPVATEADLPGIVAGAYLGGKRAVMIMENSGIRQCCEPLARFAYTHHMPMVMLMAFRGGFPEYNYWGHAHAQVMGPLLDALRIPYWFVERLDDIKPRLRGAWIHADSSQWPLALVFTGECVEVPTYAQV